MSDSFGNQQQFDEMVDLLCGFQTEIKVDQLRMWLAGSGQLERIVELRKRTEALLDTVKGEVES